jgi:hypothetical protein
MSKSFETQLVLHVLLNDGLNFTSSNYRIIKKNNNNNNYVVKLFFFFFN